MSIHESQLKHDPVLFVGDDVISHFLNCDTRRQSGFAVLEASSASDACAAIDQHPRLSALVTDIELGSGADGFEVARRARGANPDISIVYISGTAARRHPREDVERSLFISKPFVPCQIVEALT